MTLNDLLNSPAGKGIANERFLQQVDDVIAAAKNGDAMAIQALFSAASEMASALESLISAKNPVAQFLVGIAPYWPVVFPASPFLAPEKPVGLGKHSEFPFDWEKVHSHPSFVKDVLLDILQLFYAIRELKLINDQFLAAGESLTHTVEVTVPSTGEKFSTDVFLDPHRLLKQQMASEELAVKRLQSLTEKIELTDFDKCLSVLAEFQGSILGLQPTVDDSWFQMAKSFLTALTDGTPELTKLAILGENRKGRKINQKGDSSEKTDRSEIRTRIFERLAGAFKALRKDF